MANILYLDLISGISGDMFLGAMLDLGVDFERLQRELSWLCADGCTLRSGRQGKSGIYGVKFDVDLAPVHEHHHEGGSEREHGGSGHSHSHEHGRDFAEIRKLIETSPYSAWVKEKAVAVFGRVAAAEGKIHGRPPEEVHFHEVGAMDSIVDIVGACLALEWLGQPRVLASAVVDGTGWIDCAHGRFPIPAPATLEILAVRKVLVSQCDEPHELVTPTGAALLAEFAGEFGPMKGLKPVKIGYGIGGRDHVTRPNVLRAVLCETDPTQSDWETDTVALLESNIDDLNPEILGNFMEAALAAGALDVFYTPIQMKKNRPGTMLSVLCPAGRADVFAAMVLKETSAFGVRQTMCERRKLKREFSRVETPYGPVAIKIGRLDGQILHRAPEYESCRALAAQKNVPVRRIYEAAIQALPGI
jgi:uncharacterized protein (TIGR00299 family) protein